MSLRDPKSLQDILVGKLKAGREAKGLKQAWIAAQLSVTVSTYNKWETGERQIKARDLARVAELENYDLAFFFDKDMAPADADLDHRKYVPPAVEAMEIMAQLQAQVERSKDDDPLLREVKKNDALRNLLGMIYKQSDERLREVTGVIFGYLHREAQVSAVVAETTKEREVANQ